jgi:hypothetical protein
MPRPPTRDDFVNAAWIGVGFVAFVLWLLTMIGAIKVASDF